MCGMTAHLAGKRRLYITYEYLLISQRTSELKEEAHSRSESTPSYIVYGALTQRIPGHIHCDWHTISVTMHTLQHPNSYVYVHGYCGIRLV
jgi:hypothetical protein